MYPMGTRSAQADSKIKLINTMGRIWSPFEKRMLSDNGYGFEFCEKL